MTIETIFYKKRSHTHGYGIFAGRSIQKGEKVLEMGGEIFSKEEVTDDMYVMQIDENFYVGTAEKGDNLELENFINHSCSPNLGFKDGDLCLYALRDIDQDEELTWDYSTSMDEEGFDLPCYCLSPECRQRIQSFHALSREWQQRLLPIALQYLRDKYGER
jgi:SET domain-containing protein